MDTRKISAGASIPVVNYSDQPYIVKGSDGSWVLCVTTGSGHEGRSGAAHRHCPQRRPGTNLDRFS